MFGGKRPRGFTIVETMIFLAISGLLFLSTIEIVDGQQNKTEFFQAIHVTFSQLQTLSNNVSDGYYATNPITGGFSCTAGSGAGVPPVLSASPNQQGQNLGCIYVGQMIQFAPGGNTNEFTIYTMVGRQYNGALGSTPVTSLAQAAPWPLSVSANIINYAHTIYLTGGLSVGSVTFTDPNANGGATQYDGMIGFMSSFAQQQPNSSFLQNGAQNVDIVPLPTVVGNVNAGYLNIANTGSNSQAYRFLNKMSEITYNGVPTMINGRLASLPITPGIIDPQGGVSICFKSASTNKVGIVKIGVNNNPTGMQLNIQDGSCP